MALHNMLRHGAHCSHVLSSCYGKDLGKNNQPVWRSSKDLVEKQSTCVAFAAMTA